MLTKKKPIKSKKQDEAELDSAMKELVKQTEALLGSSDDEKDKSAKKAKLVVEKPVKKMSVSPKKKIIPHTNGKNFDIVSRPKKPKIITATLKTATASRPKVADSVDSGPLSSVDKEFDKDTDHLFKSDDTLNSAPAKIIHQKGNLRTQEVSDKDSSESTSGEVPQQNPSQMVTRNGINFLQADDIPEAGNDTISFFEEPDEEPENGALVDSATTVTKIESDTSETKITSQRDGDTVRNDLSDDILSEDQKRAEKSASKDSGELYANNLIKEKTPKGYVPLASQEKPTVFDTTEYHVELHDWSKLDKSPVGKWLILGLLIICLAAFTYLFVLGQPLPFVST